MAARTKFAAAFAVTVAMSVTFGVSMARADGADAAADMAAQPQGNGTAVAPVPIEAAVPKPLIRRNNGQIRFVRRPVAVIDLTDDQAVRDVANRLLDLLATHIQLGPPAISDGAALVDKLPVDDEQGIAGAERKRASAERNLAQRNFREAAIDAVEGQELLAHVTPPKALALYADLALALGQSRLGEQKEAGAREVFALAYRLDPRRSLDETHYLPEVVQAYEAAKRAQPGTGSVAVRGAGQVWIDGEEVGPAPGVFTATYGRHVVWLTGFLREPNAKEVTVSENRPGDVTILDGPLTRPQQVVRFRLALAQASDSAARTVAMINLAGFVNVHDAVLLWSIDGKIVYQTWRDHDEGFSMVHDLGRDSPSEILKQLVPPPPIEPLPPSVVISHPQPAEPPRWYHRTSVQIGIGAAVVAALVGGYVWVHYSEPARAWDSNITGFGTGASGQ